MGLPGSDVVAAARRTNLMRVPVEVRSRRARQSESKHSDDSLMHAKRPRAAW
jgi:hypothetical protein